MTVSAEPETPESPQAPAAPARPVTPGPPSVATRIGGHLVANVAAVVTAVAELFLTPLHIGGFPVPVAIPLAVVLNWVLCRFAVHTTGRRWALGPPAAIWTTIMLIASGARRREGDYLVTDTNWVAMLMILVGSLTFAVYAYRVILRPPQL